MYDPSHLHSGVVPIPGLGEDSQGRNQCRPQALGRLLEQSAFWGPIFSHLRVRVVVREQLVFQERLSVTAFDENTPFTSWEELLQEHVNRG